ncbi:MULTISPECIES: PTS sugar transporter subunit IIA [unclassified Staphylococcus]|uniref:PTS sugar transporter subunit IIA n=1 Tax=unclassified Staphylococcus TaxID=91994 RepID=UPI0021CEB4B1|nr:MULTISPECIES: PTS sugar transporter subunit IIA [unclassified Staphylococcus]UXR69182.1 PTS sugar transporter subunit IIA [Staphylococcus sp. IVB6246]UXR71237.1 PTS sugar transporter subunit IIA [Staphylococcus sp. IVB6240]UXR73511.1 PTS sugar transporter subunit IIA [Staphylococcus sp. IVB6238]UXR75830.1 PTS sugar transporter subunit IIA [Staphylococcus sp. IVB6233]UXR80028.1 PTS sugar transporter subunit IIA [Staphylococcus sp. IVB6218]
MENLLHDNNILLNQSFNTKAEAIERAGQLLVQSGAVTEDYIPAMLERETIVSTYMGNFLAIPHGTDDAKTAVLDSSLALLQIPGGLDWDGEEVKVVIGIAGKDGTHLELLSQIAIAFSDEDNIDKIVNADSKDEIRRILEEADV